jgi:hypothetical protein
VTRKSPFSYEERNFNLFSTHKYAEMFPPKTRSWPFRVTRKICLSKKLDEIFARFVDSRHGRVSGGYSTEVENAMMLEMTRWNYTPYDERAFLRVATKVFGPSDGQLEEVVFRVVRVNSALDAAFKSFVLLAYGGIAKNYSLAVQNGMFLLVVLSRFASIGEFVD